MVEKKVLVQEVELKEKKTLKQLLEELKLSHRSNAVLINGKRVTDLDIIIDEKTKIIILPKIRGG
ncbi:MAG: MoaD/ThiS family protein [Candidatus Helarchaeota archaeon]